MNTVETLIVGGGQAGLAMSAHLRAQDRPHLILERNRIAESWRTARWDSLVANGPAWHDRFAAKEFSGIDGDAFPTKDEVVRYFEEFAAEIDAPIRCGVEVISVAESGNGYIAHTSEGEITARNVVAATGPFQKPIIPPVLPQIEGVTQIHSNHYRNPDQLDDGAVLVVGSGSSGAQIADELLRAGRDVYLSIGPHDRPPRRYRTKDFVWWLGVLGKWQATAADPSTQHVTISVSGAYGGRTIDFRHFAQRGMHLLGMTDHYANGVLHFAEDLAANIHAGDANYLGLLAEADAYVEKTAAALPEEPEAKQIAPDPDCVTNPTLSLNVADAGISTVIWATGYALDFDWLKVDAFDAQGRPDHHRGVSKAPGFYFLGLPWLSQRGSSFIWGVWNDANYLARHIADAMTKTG